MTAEAPTKKSWDKEPITACEWKANQAAVAIVKAEDSAEFRLKLKRKIATLLGSEYTPANARLMHVKLAEYLVKIGLLQKPDWHSKSTLHMDHFTTEDLAAAYTAIKGNTKPVKPVEVDDNEPF